MQTEYEATFTNIDKEKMREQLKAAGATLARPEYFQRREEFKLPNDNSVGKWLRVRDESDRITMSFKWIQQGGKEIADQKEIDLVVDDFEKAVAFLQAAGCENTGYRENYRELWLLGGVEVTIDSWPYLEPLVELEGRSEEAVKKAATKLGFDWKEAIFNSIDVVYAQEYNTTPEAVCFTKDISFKHPNPFA